MAISRVPGFSLLANLDRQGTDLSLTSSGQTLFYWDVNNYRIGVNTATPNQALEVVGNVLVTNGHSYTSANLSFDLGQNANRWRTVYVGNVIADTVTGTILTNNQPYITSIGGLVINPTTGNLTVNNLSVTDSISANIVTANSFVGGNANLNYLTAGTLQSGTTHIPASQYQLYVAKNGNDSNDGTINAPYLTIKTALAAAANISSSTGVSVQVAPGSYTEDNPITIPPKVALMGDNLRNVSIVPNTPAADLFYMTNGCYVWGVTIRNYLANGFSYNSSTSSQNVFVSPYIQNITSATTTGTAVMVDGNNTSAISTKAMIVGFFTIINQGGYGVRLVNSAYSQLVNIYTIACEVGVWCESGSFCTLNGSDNGIGNIGLRADGYGPLLSTGQTVGYSINGIFILNNLTAPPHVNQVMIINGDPNYYSIDTITKIDNVTYQVNVQEVYQSNLAPSSNISFYQRSKVVASAHTFEYVGAGTNPANALPQYGGLPDATKNVIFTGGGQVTFTATDEKGNFFIGPNLTINQATGTISGDAFTRSLFQIMTPYILALEVALS